MPKSERVSASRPVAKRRRGFTLVELLVVIAIIGVLVALLLPAVQAAREAARRADCQSKLHNIGIALQNYVAARGELPVNYGTGGAYADKTSHSWILLTLPFLEQQALYASVNQKDGFNLPGQGNSIAAETALPVLLCPSDPSNNGGLADNRADSEFAGDTTSTRYGVTNFKANAGSNWCYGAFYHRENVGLNAKDCNGVDFPTGWTSRNLGRLQRLRFKEISDGLSSTFAVGETVISATRWASWYWHNNTSGTCAIPLNFAILNEVPDSDFTLNYSFNSRHVGGGQFSMFDASVRFISQEIDRAPYLALSTVQAEETIPPQ